MRQRKIKITFEATITVEPETGAKAPNHVLESPEGELVYAPASGGSYGSTLEFLHHQLTQDLQALSVDPDENTVSYEWINSDPGDPTTAEKGCYAPLKWRYALLKIGPDPDDNELVEYYYSSSGVCGGSFCGARIGSVVELQRALSSVQKHGIQTWFFDHGSFSRDPNGNLNWTPHAGPPTPE